MEKLEIIIKLVSEKNIDQVLLELKEYATEVDVDFVRKSVSAIGRCAVKLERAAERCIGVLLELIQTKVNYVVQESVIVIKDIFRRYPNRYESIIATLCDNLDTLDEPLAKASMIWIIGEYAERIDNADELLDTFLETFEEEDPAVQLQLLTATVKCFLKNPEDTQEMVQRVLDMATEETDNPDLRDRGFIYWRLLSTDPEAAKIVVLGDKPVIEDDTFRLEPSLLNILIGQIATLSSVYHKPPEAFVVRGPRGTGGTFEEEEEDEEEYEDENDVGGDLLDIGGLSVQDKFQAPQVQLTQVCSADKSDGIDIYAGFHQSNSTLSMDVEFHNVSCSAPLSTLAIQLNKNSFGLSPANQQIVCNPPIPQGGRGRNTIELVITPNMLAPIPAGQPASPQVQVAIKNMATGNVFYFAANFTFEALFSPDGALDRSAFIESWKSIDDTNELYGTVSDLPPSSTDIDQVQAKFKAYNIFFIARRPVPNAVGQEVVYFSMRTITGMDFLAELTFKQGVNACKVCLKTENSSYGILAKTALETILRN
jgi:AP-1 complex subunit beta-1